MFVSYMYTLDFSQNISTEDTPSYQGSSKLKRKDCGCQSCLTLKVTPDRPILPIEYHNVNCKALVASTEGRWLSLVESARRP